MRDLSPEMRRVPLCSRQPRSHAACRPCRPCRPCRTRRRICRRTCRREAAHKASRRVLRRYFGRPQNRNAVCGQSSGGGAWTGPYVKVCAEAQIKAESRLDRHSWVESSLMPHIDVAIPQSIVASLATKVVEPQPMSLMGRDAEFRSQLGDWLGTFWAHSVSTEVNSGESQLMLFRSSAPVQLCDQARETGSIPGSSTTYE